ncbi:PREDICTED: uncharacterized protein LOC108556539 [Nicrophorus vespilloides]|uniref:Uncharacterized protein LOC108556539 n=1 Tax=Nicrophorus vespilloides TaxID=110193 RepID=A0ABM1M0T1_NICVS|nr:PREDICTED: uncharacterized protein LOC108556539 [Nicrophorus vespilloides]
MSAVRALMIFCLFANNVFGIEDASNMQSYGIMENIEGAIENLENVVQKGIDDGLNMINDVYEKMMSLPMQVVLETRKALTVVISKTGDEINAMVKKAENLGVDVSECTKSTDYSLNSIAIRVMPPLMNCMLGKICEAKVILEKAVSDINGYVDVIYEMQAKVTECGSGVASLKCLAGVLADITKTSVQVPLEMMKMVKQVLALMGTMQEAVTECGTAAMATATKQCAGVALDVGKCVSAKINGTFILLKKKQLFVSFITILYYTN